MTKLMKTIIAFLIMTAALFYLFFGPTAVRQLINIKKAERYIPNIKRVISQYPYFSRIKVEVNTGNGGVVLIGGSIKSEKDIDELKILVDATNPPVNVIYDIRQENIDYEYDYYFSGMDKSIAGNYDRAIGDFTIAIEMAPNFIVAYNERGHAKYQKGAYEGAIADYTRAIELKPNNFEIYCRRADAKGYKRDYEGAIEDYSKGLKIAPDNWSAYWKIKLLKYLKDKYGGKPEEIAIRHNYIMAEQCRADYFYYKGDFDNAINEYTKIIEVEPKHFYAYYERGKIKYEKGDYIGAVDDYTKAMEFMEYKTKDLDDSDIKHYTDYYHRVALAKYRKGDYAGAVADWEKALNLDPANKIRWDLLIDGAKQEQAKEKK